MAVTITTTASELAKAAQQSPGYSVVASERGCFFVVQGIRFERTHSGRLNRSVVLASVDGRPARFDANTPFRILD